MIISSVITVAHGANPSSQAVLQALDLFEIQSNKVPFLVKQNMYLTGVEVDEQNRQVFRTFHFASLNYGAKNTGYAKQLRQELTLELFRQCEDHHQLIFDHEFAFHYRFADRNSRIFALEIIDKQQCRKFLAIHC